MPIEVSWAVQDQVILITPSGNFSMEEVRQMDEKIVTYLRGAAPDKVHIIGNISELKSMPPLGEMLRLRGKNESNMGWILVVGQRSAVNRALMDLFARLANRQLRNMASMDEALQFLEAQRGK